ncbi:MAG: ComF family protein [Clostridia bacterium]|nr:ComF family protein [Clostridia bacterium]
MPFKTMLLKALSLIFPDQCIFCGSILGYCKSQLCICPDCAKKITFSDEVDTCRLCGRQMPDEEMPLCPTCQSHRHYFNRAVSCASYKDDIREAVLRFKFGNCTDYARTFAAMMVRRIRPLCKTYGFDLTVCAPLSKASMNERGYNQAALLAKPIAKALGLAYCEKAFIKTKETPKQSTLNYIQRMKNVENVFALDKDPSYFAGKTILLIDDVLTTGATADALSKLLKAAGAKIVVVATLACTEKDKNNELTNEDWKEITF